MVTGKRDGMQPITAGEADDSHQCWWRRLAEGLAGTLADLDSDSALSALREMLRSEKSRRRAAEQRAAGLEAELQEYREAPSDGYDLRGGLLP